MNPIERRWRACSTAGRRGVPEDINAWWDRVPGERYWLDVTDRDDRGRLLATPRGEGRTSALWTTG
jgi:hypothetical protein